MRVARPIILTSETRRELESIARSSQQAARAVERARIILLAAVGTQDQDIGAHLKISRQKVARWRARFLAEGVMSLHHDAPRSGAPKHLPKSIAEEVVAKTINEKPDAATHWSRTTMAQKMGISPSTVGRIWRAHGLKPHRVDSFKLSNDPNFVDKLQDIVGLYLSPPEHALVFCCDEKSQIQALDRTQPCMPIKRGRCGTMTHDYTRHGTTTLFAALNTLDGSVIGTCMPKHRHQEWLKFLKFIDQQTPPEKDLHLVVDNYATHKHPNVKAWLSKHPRFHIHFTPTSASWLNMVERFFRGLTHNRLRRDSFASVSQLITAIDNYMAKQNREPKPLIWTAKASDILEKVTRARSALNKFHNL